MPVTLLSDSNLVELQNELQQHVSIAMRRSRIIRKYFVDLPIHSSSPRRWGPKRATACAQFAEMHLGFRLRGNDEVIEEQAYRCGDETGN